jgi:hypothetical protein
MEIKNLDDLRAKRAGLNNEVELAKLKLEQDKLSWKEEFQPLKKAADVASNMIVNKHQGLASKGLQLGVNAIIAKTVLRRLPVPLNFILPYVAQNLVINYAHEHSEGLLVKFLKIVKHLTEEEKHEERLQYKEKYKEVSALD